MRWGGAAPEELLSYWRQWLFGTSFSRSLARTRLVVPVVGEGGIRSWLTLSVFSCSGCAVTVFDLRKGFSDDRVKFIEGNLVKKVRGLRSLPASAGCFHGFGVFGIPGGPSRGLQGDGRCVSCRVASPSCKRRRPRQSQCAYPSNRVHRDAAVGCLDRCPRRRWMAPRMLWTVVWRQTCLVLCSQALPAWCTVAPTK
jgi:hypothetical protein